MNSKNWTRRQLLRGTGIALAVPWLETFSPSYAHAAGAGAPKRYIGMYFPNGTADFWKPSGAGATWTPSPILEPFTSNKAHVTVLGNVGNYSPWGGHIEPSHGHNGASAWTGTRPVKAANGQSIDQAIADQIVADNGGKLATPLHSLQVGLSTLDSSPDGVDAANSRSMAWKSADSPLFKLVSPQGVFDFMVGGKPLPTGNGMPTAPDPLVERRRLLKKSALDYIIESAGDLQKKLSTSDRVRLDHFLSSVRTLELRVSDPTMPAPLSCTPAKRPTDVFAVGNTPAGYSRGAHATLMVDLVVMAIQCDITRVVSFMLDDARSDYVYNFLTTRKFTATGSTAGAGAVGSYHGAQHAGPTDNGMATINYWNVERCNELATKLAAIPEGGSNVLENSVITFLSGMNGGNHDGQNLPIAIVGSGGGILKSGQYITFPKEVPLQNVHLTVLQKVFGSKATKFGKPEGAYVGSEAIVPEIVA